MKYLFVAIRNHDDVAPIGLAYVAAALRQSGRHISSFNFGNHKDPIKVLLQKIEYNDIDVLCLGALSEEFSYLRDTIATVRKNCPSVKIIVGGGIITAEPEFMIQHLDMDFGCVGYGEETICEFAECLETHGDFSKIKGLIYKDETGQFIINPRRPEPENLDNIPFPALDLFGLNSSSRLLPILGSRSCTHNCTFCFHSSGYRYKNRSLDNIFLEIEYWKEKFDITIVNFFDELFGYKKEHIYEFCRRIKILGLKFIISLRVDIVSEELIKVLSESGCVYIGYGIESVNQQVLDSMRKQITVEQIEYALKITKQYNIKSTGNILFGDRVETYEMATETLLWWLKNIHFGLNIMFINAYPGTVMYKHGVKTGRIQDKLKFLEDKCRKVNLSAMSDAEFSRLHEQVKLMMGLVMKTANKTRFEIGEDGVVLVCGDCPHCGTTISVDYEQVDLTFDLFDRQSCTKCGSCIKLFPKERDNLLDKSYFNEFNYKGKKIAVWGLTPKAKFRLASNRNMRDAVVVIVDRDYQRFENKFLGFEVQSPKVLSKIEFDVLYIGSDVSRLGIFSMAKEIIGSEIYHKEIMLIP